MSFIAPNPTFNASLNDGHTLQGQIQAARIGANPRLYANESGGQSFFPETDAQDNSDMPPWVVLGPSLQSQGVDPGLPIYLQVWIAERNNFYDVAQVQRLVNAGVPFDQALS